MDDSNARAEQRMPQRATRTATLAKEAAGSIGDTVAGSAGRMGEEARLQARHVFEDATTQLRSRIDTEVENVASSIDEAAAQLRALAEGRPEEAGTARSYVERGAAQLDGMARRVRSDGIDGIVLDVERFARRRPGTFLVLSGLAGMAAARLVRARAAARGSDGEEVSGPGRSWLRDGYRDRYDERFGEPSEEGSAWESATGPGGRYAGAGYPGAGCSSTAHAGAGYRDVGDLGEADAYDLPEERYESERPTTQLRPATPFGDPNAGPPVGPPVPGARQTRRSTDDAGQDLGRAGGWR